MRAFSAMSLSTSGWLRIDVADHLLQVRAAVHLMDEQVLEHRHPARVAPVQHQVHELVLADNARETPHRVHVAREAHQLGQRVVAQRLGQLLLVGKHEVHHARHALRRCDRGCGAAVQ